MNIYLPFRRQALAGALALMLVAGCLPAPQPTATPNLGSAPTLPAAAPAPVNTAPARRHGHHRHGGLHHRRFRFVHAAQPAGRLAGRRPERARGHHRVRRLSVTLLLHCCARVGATPEGIARSSIRLSPLPAVEHP